MKKLYKMILSACLVFTFVFNIMNNTLNVKADSIVGFPGHFDVYGLPNPESADLFLELPLAVNAKHYYYQQIENNGDIARNDLSLEFDSNGRFLKSEMNKVEYDDQGRRIRIETGAYFANRGEIYEIKYNELGLIDSYTKTWKSDKLVHGSYKFDYNENEHVCNVTVTELEGSQWSQTYEQKTYHSSIMEFDPDYGWERVIRTKSLSSYYPEEVQYITDYTYDESGNLIRKKEASYLGCYFKETTRGNKTFIGSYLPIDMEEYVYDEQNRRIQKTVYRGNEYVNEQYEVMDYDMSWITYNYSYEYDEQNRLIKITELRETPGYYDLDSSESSPVFVEESYYVAAKVVTYTY